MYRWNGVNLVMNQTWFVITYDITKHQPREMSTGLPPSAEYLGGIDDPVPVGQVLDTAPLRQTKSNKSFEQLLPQNM